MFWRCWPALVLMFDFFVSLFGFISAFFPQNEPGSVGLMQNLEKLLTILAKNFAYVRRRQKRAVTTLPPFSLASKNIRECMLARVHVRCIIVAFINSRLAHWLFLLRARRCLPAPCKSRRIDR